MTRKKILHWGLFGITPCDINHMNKGKNPLHFIPEDFLSSIPVDVNIAVICESKQNTGKVPKTDNLHCFHDSAGKFKIHP